MIIAVDFDGTCVRHAYPRVGEDIGAVPVLKRMVAEGHQIVLNTMRSHKHSKFILPELGTYDNIDTLQEAIDWFQKNDIPLYGVNHTPDQENWTDSPKVYAHLYIDDASLGIPLNRECVRPYVDWKEVARLFGYTDLI